MERLAAPTRGAGAEGRHVGRSRARPDADRLAQASGASLRAAKRGSGSDAARRRRMGLDHVGCNWHSPSSDGGLCGGRAVSP